MTLSYSYSKSRKAFLNASESVGAVYSSYVLDDFFGLKDEELAIDVATVGSSDAKNVVVVTSGIHGVELPIGSALQCEWLVAANVVCSRDKNTRFVFVHALNPYGAAHGLRNDQENIDLNRNFVDFGHIPETSESYSALASALSPKSFNPFAIANAWINIFSFVKENGSGAFKQALVGGQYKFPDGLYYGGDHPSWTRKTWEKIAESHIIKPDMQNLWHIDIHSGVGPYGEMTVLVNAETNDELYKRAEPIAGKKLRLSQPSFGVLTGDITDYWKRLGVPGACKISPMTIENGTTKSRFIKERDILAAMMLRNALFVQYGDKHRAAKNIIHGMRATFIPPEWFWQQKTMRQGRNFGKRMMNQVSPK